MICAYCGTRLRYVDCRIVEDARRGSLHICKEADACTERKAERDRQRAKGEEGMDTDLIEIQRGRKYWIELGGQRVRVKVLDIFEHNGHQTVRYRTGWFSWPRTAFLESFREKVAVASKGEAYAANQD